jgi:hypothetical protein
MYLNLLPRLPEIPPSFHWAIMKSLFNKPPGFNEILKNPN